MNRGTSRNLYLASLGALLVVPPIAFFAQFVLPISILNRPLYGAILTTAVVSSILWLIGYVGALVKMARLNQWVWLVLLILFAPITMLVYIFAGPTKPAATAGYARVEQIPP